MSSHRHIGSRRSWGSIALAILATAASWLAVIAVIVAGRTLAEATRWDPWSIGFLAGMIVLELRRAFDRWFDGWWASTRPTFAPATTHVLARGVDPYRDNARPFEVPVAAYGTVVPHVWCAGCDVYVERGSTHSVLCGLDEPNMSIGGVVLEYAPHLLGHPMNARTVNELTGLSFRDGDMITPETVRHVRAALEARAPRITRRYRA